MVLIVADIYYNVCIWTANEILSIETRKKMIHLARKMQHEYNHAKCSNIIFTCKEMLVKFLISREKELKTILKWRD